MRLAYQSIRRLVIAFFGCLLPWLKSTEVSQAPFGDTLGLSINHRRKSSLRFPSDSKWPSLCGQNRFRRVLGPRTSVSRFLGTSLPCIDRGEKKATVVMQSHFAHQSFCGKYLGSFSRVIFTCHAFSGVGSVPESGTTVHRLL